MSNELMKSKVEEIKKLHNGVLESIKLSIDGAIRIGELLTECKKEVGHGNWMQWVKDNCGFSQKTANNYFKAYQRKDDPKFVTVTNLRDIYYPQIEHKPEPLPVRLQPIVDPEPQITEPLPKLDEPVTPVAPVTKTEVIAPTPKVEPKVEPSKVDSLVDSWHRHFNPVPENPVMVLRNLYTDLEDEQQELFFEWVMDNPPFKFRDAA
jgi:hypothetical protein